MKIDRERFFALQEKMSVVPFNQSRGWNEFYGGADADIDYFVDSDSAPTVAVWGRRHKVPFFGGSILKINGESFGETLNPKALTELYGEIFNNGYAATMLSSLTPPNVEYEVAVRKAGFVRPLGCAACPLSVLVNIAEPEKRSRMWKRSCNKATQAGLTFEELRTPSSEQCESFARMYAEMTRIKKIDRSLNGTDFKKIFDGEGYTFYIVRLSDGTPVSERVVYTRGGRAEDVYAATSAQGRECGASYFMMENIFESLRAKGIVDFDFSRIAPGLGSGNGVCDFKMYSGGRPIQYSGEWIRSKNKYLELGLFVYQTFFKKGARY